jgi:GNAT superfamily N-acetyltransferase
MSGVVFRRVAREEAAQVCGALAALHAEAHASGMALGLLAPVDLEALAADYRELVASLGARMLFVAELDGDVVGMAQLVPSEAQNAIHRAEVQRIAVATSARGSGIGRGLMATVEEAARVQGVSLLWLTTHAGTDACRFYAAVGYTELGVMPDYSRRPDGTLAPGAFFFRQL